MKQKKNYNLVLGLAALVVIVAVFAVVGWIVSRPRPLVIQGEAEAAEYRVSGKVPGRIDSLCVKEGMNVHKGDTVAFIDSPEVRAKLAQARAAKAAALAQNRKAVNGAQKEQVDGAFELWQQAKTQEEVMRKSFERVQRLFDQKVVSEQKYDETKARYDAAAAQTRAAKSQYDMALNGARQEDKDAARAVVARADGAIEEVESYMSELCLVAPCSGVVSEVFPKAGELVGTGSPIMTIQDMADVWFTFNIREDYLHGMKMGDTLSLRIPALDGRVISATVNYIAVRDSYATWKATKETDMYDAKTFEVRAVPDSPVDGLRPGMTALVIKSEK